MKTEQHLILKSAVKWLKDGEVAVYRPKAYYRPAGFYFVIKSEEPGVKIGDDYVTIPLVGHLREDRRGKPYVVPSLNGKWRVVHERWSGDRGHRPETYARTAKIEALGRSNGGGAGEYWAVVPLDAKDDRTLEELDALGEAP